MYWQGIARLYHPLDGISNLKYKLMYINNYIFYKENTQ